MMTVDALKALYVALGGSTTDTYSTIANGIAVADYVLIPDCILAIAEVAGSTLELPAVTTTDNGDVLTVSAGKWTKAAPVKELPAVTGDDDGKVLKVVDGAWAVGTDSITA